jgi:hypothetical protein
MGLVRGGREICPSGQLRDIDLNPYLLKDLGDLVEDAIYYIEWTLNWPNDGSGNSGKNSRTFFSSE